MLLDYTILRDDLPITSARLMVRIAMKLWSCNVVTNCHRRPFRIKVAMTGGT